MKEAFDQFDSETDRILESVKMLSHPDLPGGAGVVQLSFGDFEVFICIEDDYDTLLCVRMMPQSHLCYTHKMPTSFWDDVLGKALTAAWQMTNDRGYPDAIQLSFRDTPSEGSQTLIQLYGEASQITLTELQVIRESS